MARDVIRLNGEWRIRFDPENRGTGAKWFAEEDFRADRTIRVPSTWNEIEPGYEGVAWYACEFPTPNVAGDEYWIRFGAVNYGADVWLNGIHVGTHEGGYTPFEVPISFPCRPAGETNRLVVRVWDPPSDDLRKRLDGTSFAEIPSGKESWYYNFSGIWQDVDLIVTDPTYLRELFVQPDVAGNRVVVSAVARTAIQESVTATVRILDAGTGETVAERTADAVVQWGSRRLRYEVPLDSPATLWDTENPHLYRAEFEIRKGDHLLDRATTRFGMREFTIRGRRYCLNGEPITVKGILNQQWYPMTTAYPTDPRHDLELMRDAGFNLIRVHIRPTLPTVLDAADEMGMLMFQEPAIGWVAPSPHLRRRAMTEISEMVLRDRNHPSIIMWGLFNEGSCRGAPDIFGDAYIFGAENVGPMVQTYKSDLVSRMRFLDPTRLISDDSGPDSAGVCLPGSDEPGLVTDRHVYRSAPPGCASEHEYRTSGPDEGFYVVSEFGSGGMDDYARVVAKFPDGVEYEDKQQLAHFHGLVDTYYRAHLTGLFDTVEDLYAASLEYHARAARRLIDLQRTNPKAAGYIWTQVADSSWENQAGLLNAWHEPKPAHAAAAEANAPLRAVVCTGAHNVEPGDPIAVEVAIVNDTKRRGTVPMHVEVCDADGRPLLQEELQVDLPERIGSVDLPTVTAPSALGWVTTTVTLADQPPTSWTNYVVKSRGPGPARDTVGTVVCPEAVKQWLQEAGITDAGPDADRFLLGPIDSYNALCGREVASALEAVRGGATAVVLGMPWGAEPVPEGEYRCWCFPRTFDNDVFPFPIRYARTENHFISQFHFMHPHPYLAGLPTGGLIDAVWADLMPYSADGQGVGEALVLDECEEISGWFGPPVAYHRRSKACTWDQCRFGQMLCRVPLEGGTLVFSSYNLVPELPVNPAARRLLWNLATADV